MALDTKPVEFGAAYLLALAPKARRELGMPFPRDQAARWVDHKGAAVYHRPEPR